MPDLGKLAPMMAELKALEDQVSDVAKAAEAHDEMRVYEWRPAKIVELPAIWNWIDDGTYEIVDTARADDLIVITATIGVQPADLTESLGRLVRLTDHFRAVVDPALWTNQPLGGTAKTAKRVLTRTGFDDFNGVPVMCMDMLIQVQLTQIIAGA